VKIEINSNMVVQLLDKKNLVTVQVWPYLLQGLLFGNSLLHMIFDHYQKLLSQKVMLNIARGLKQLTEGSDIINGSQKSEWEKNRFPRKHLYLLILPPTGYYVAISYIISYWAYIYFLHSFPTREYLFTEKREEKLHKTELFIWENALLVWRATTGIRCRESQNISTGKLKSWNRYISTP
jgi:hypothetical protein